MSIKRMFSTAIVRSDAFLDMPVSSRDLYFQLGMEVDDDGFVGNPRRVMKMLGASDDDLKILITKGFVIVFESGVLVIKHHRMHNNFDKHNAKMTVYMEEFSKLYLKENRAYTLDYLQGLPLQSGVSLAPVSNTTKHNITKHNKYMSEEQHSLFQEFWKNYPNKKGKEPAMRTWGKMTPEEMALAIEDMKKRPSQDKQWVENDGRYIPHPTTYLNQKRWADEWVAVKPKPVTKTIIVK